MKQFSIGHQRLGSAKQQSYHVKKQHDKELTANALAKVQEARKAKQLIFKEMHQDTVKQGKRCCKELLKALSDGEIDNDWIDHVKEITSATAHPFIRMSDHHWRRIIKTHRAFRLRKKHEEEVLNKITKCLGGV